MKVRRDLSITFVGRLKNSIFLRPTFSRRPVNEAHNPSSIYYEYKVVELIGLGRNKLQKNGPGTNGPEETMA
jgi:hypothetical protein